MRLLPIFFLFIACEPCFASDEPKTVAVSDWSKPVDGSDNAYNGAHAAAVRGRLVILQGHSPGDTGELLSTMVYVELQNLSLRPTEVYFDGGHGNDLRPEHKGGLHCDLFDSRGTPVPRRMSAFSGQCPTSQWITLPGDDTIRLRANCFGIGSPKEGGLVLPFLDKEWFIESQDDHHYFLSASFTATSPANHVSGETKHLRNVVWDGTLMFPKLDILVRTP